MADLWEPGLRTLCVPVRATRHAAVRAIRAVAGSRRWQIRQGRRWIPAELQDSHRGPCWLSLHLQADASAAGPRAHYRVSIWQPRISATAWRRLCLLAGAAQRLRASPVQGAS
ncbi:hypothetical protein CAL20_07595 [Bordetella genomosp. 4]|uniref:Uncharacterized protein n=1 Tax=Bordetella genomosp. 4 TaxID=463044 RepID=A0A261UA89_9BORD|nr:hypothetical protein CAL20_07595 [Bordetella genomosp. 4]